MRNQKELHSQYGWEYPYLHGMDLALHGNRRETRNGATFAQFAHQMRFDLKKGFPLLTTKKVNFDLIVAELLWFIEGGRKPNKGRGEVYGRLSIHRLSEIYGKPCHIWDGDAKNFDHKDRAQFSGDCGRIYGAQWRGWNGANRKNIDQLANVIHLLRTDPTSRYMRVTAWNPAELDDMALPACHTGFQCFVRFGKDGKKYLSLHMNQRSCDMFLGVPFNIASYALKTHMLAQVCGYEVDELVITLNDYHVYEKHRDAVKKQLVRTPHRVRPKLWINPEVKDIDSFKMEDFKILNYYPQASIKAELLTAVVKK